ncbi:MAG: hypothetical protein IJT90_07290 [Bacteroidaceae bacterium]|nr:hypothetical protein [Bacteroidaceae bacterium]
MKFTKLEMAKALSKDSRIEIKKGFLGMGATATYTTTGSKLQVIKAECTLECGQRMERIINSKDAALDKQLSVATKFKETVPGQCMLEAVVSADHAFVAMRLYRFTELGFAATTDLAVYEGDTARKVAQLF